MIRVDTKKNNQFENDLRGRKFSVTKYEFRICYNTAHTVCTFWFPWEIDRLFAYALRSFLFSVGDQEGHSSKRITLGPNAQVTHWSASLLQRFMGIHLVFTALRSISFSPILRFLKINRCNLKFHKLSYRAIHQW